MIVTFYLQNFHDVSRYHLKEWCLPIILVGNMLVSVIFLWSKKADKVGIFITGHPVSTERQYLFLSDDTIFIFSSTNNTSVILSALRSIHMLWNQDLAVGSRRASRLSLRRRLYRTNSTSLDGDHNLSRCTENSIRFGPLQN